jgi:hypothetical protein
MVIQSFADLAKIIGVYWLALIALFGAVGLLGYAGEKFLGFLPARVRKTISNSGYYLMAGLLLWFIMGSVIGWFVDLPGAQRGPREGEPCGPGYRWTRVGPAIDPELSCEKE